MFDIRISLRDRVIDARTDGRVIHTPQGEVSFAEATLLPPCTPSKIVCVGFNYLDHAHELDAEIPEEPLLFLKPPSALIASGDTIVYPPGCTQLDYEAELAVVFGKAAKNVTEGSAMEYVHGFTVFNDVTARNYQRSDKLWTRAKGFDTFAPMGPWIVARDEVDFRDVRVKSYLNGEVRQDSSTDKLIFGIPELIAYASRIMTLEPGDVMATGTPPGVGSMRVGDRIEIEVEGVGKIANPIGDGGL